jgi:hypothetical protein
MKQEKKLLVLTDLGILALAAAALLASCKPPVEPRIELPRESVTVFDPSVTPLTFVNPAYLLAEGDAATSAVFELSEAREGAVSIYADPACTQPALLTALLAGDTLTVVVTGGGVFLFLKTRRSTPS